MSAKARKARPATQEERNAMQWKPVELPPLDKEAWATHYNVALLAWSTMAKTPDELQEAMKRMCDDGIAPSLLDQFVVTKEFLRGAADIIGKASLRSYLVLERLGYSPDNPPPDKYESDAAD